MPTYQTRQTGWKVSKDGVTIKARATHYIVVDGEESKPAILTGRFSPAFLLNRIGLGIAPEGLKIIVRGREGPTTVPGKKLEAGGCIKSLVKLFQEGREDLGLESVDVRIGETADTVEITLVPKPRLNLLPPRALANTIYLRLDADYDESIPVKKRTVLSSKDNKSNHLHQSLALSASRREVFLRYPTAIGVHCATRYDVQKDANIIVESLLACERQARTIAEELVRKGQDASEAVARVGLYRRELDEARLKLKGRLRWEATCFDALHLPSNHDDGGRAGALKTATEFVDGLTDKQALHHIVSYNFWSEPIRLKSRGYDPFGIGSEFVDIQEMESAETETEGAEPSAAVETTVAGGSGAAGVESEEDAGSEEEIVRQPMRAKTKARRDKFDLAMSASLSERNELNKLWRVENKEWVDKYEKNRQEKRRADEDLKEQRRTLYWEDDEWRYDFNEKRRRKRDEDDDWREMDNQRDRDRHLVRGDKMNEQRRKKRAEDPVWREQDLKNQKEIWANRTEEQRQDYNTKRQKRRAELRVIAERERIAKGIPKKPIGRPKGTKSKATLEKEAALAAANESGDPEAIAAAKDAFRRKKKRDCPVQASSEEDKPTSKKKRGQSSKSKVEDVAEDSE